MKVRGAIRVRIKHHDSSVHHRLVRMRQNLRNTPIGIEHEGSQ